MHLWRSAVLLAVAALAGCTGDDPPDDFPTITPVSSPTPLSESTATLEPTPTLAPEWTSTPTHAPLNSPTPTRTPTPPPIPTPTATLESTQTPEPTPTATLAPTPTASPTPTPDPALIGPPLDTTLATTFESAVSFLYEGENPVQVGVMPGTIDPAHMAVLRGRVLTTDGDPLPNAKVTVARHPEYGYTLSRIDGKYDLAINGGDWISIEVRLEGYIPAQRTLETQWQTFNAVDDVRLVAYDTEVTEIDFQEDQQVARGSVEADADGARQATLLFAQNTVATMTLPDGQVQQLNQLHVRATEYTVGEGGPDAMPAALPPTSGYTYAVELSVDEAIEAGATAVSFSAPVPVYLENFLDFPVGGIVPVGYYDLVRSVWVPSDNGIVLEVLETSSGTADLDVEGLGQPASLEVLNALGITDAERARLATLYPPGQTLWRVAVSHFSPHDCNWPNGPPPGATSPTSCDNGQCDRQPESCAHEVNGSIIECQNQVLGERLPLVGIPGTLNYRSNRTAGWKAGRTLTIPLTPATLPPNLLRVELALGVGDQLERTTYAAAPDLSHSWTWDGKVYGQPWNGELKALVKLSYIYPAYYYGPALFEQSFAQYPAGVEVLANRTNNEIAVVSTWEVPVAHFVRDFWPVGGWTLDMHHHFSPQTQTVYQGDGKQRRVDAIGQIITRIAGTGARGGSGDGGLATLAKLNGPHGIATDANGYTAFADTGNNLIRVLDPSGLIYSVPLNGVRLDYPLDVALDPAGNLFIVDTNHSAIWRRTPEGVYSVVAGGGNDFGYCKSTGDGGPATAAFLCKPSGIALDGWGNYYIADTYNNRIRRVDTNGTITTVAGNSVGGFCGDGGPATSACLNLPSDVVVDKSGTLYIADQDNFRVRRVSTDGTISTFAGNGTNNYSGDGGPASSAGVMKPTSLAIDAYANLYIAAYYAPGVRRIDSDGTISTVAGGGNNSCAGAGEAATATRFTSTTGVAIDSAGRLLVSDDRCNKIYRVTHPEFVSVNGDYLVGSSDGREVFHFDGEGRHLDTRDALTGAPLFTFTYNEAGQLASVEDGDGLQTDIERAIDGNPTALIGPYGQRTTLALDVEGNLSAVSDPGGETWTLEYAEAGLLTSLVEPDGNATSSPEDFAHHFLYDALGRLTSDQDPVGGSLSLNRTELDSGYSVAISSALGRTSTYEVERLTTGGTLRKNTGPEGSLQTDYRVDAGRYTISPDGSTFYLQYAPDPRWGMSSPLAAASQVKLPSSLTYLRTQSRAVTLADANDPLSMLNQTDTITVNGRTSRIVYDANILTQTLTSAAGRTLTRTLDDRGRMKSATLEGSLLNVLGAPVQLHPMTLEYDEDGRVSEMRQGDRLTQYLYHADGLGTGQLQTAIGPDGLETTLDYDASQRITEAVLPDDGTGRIVSSSYAPGGDPSVLTPPGRPDHHFAYTQIHQLDAYDPPALQGDESGALDFTYSLDHELLETAWALGTRTYEYDATTGQQTALILPTERIDATYLPSGQLEAITTSVQDLTVAYDGMLPTQVTAAGLISGSVTWTYDTDFRVKTEKVSGGQTVSMAYDADGLLTGAGSLTLTRDLATGLQLGTSLGTTTDAIGYSAYAEQTAYEARVATTSVFSSTVLARDARGRLERWTEAVEGQSHTFEVQYDSAGRLIEVLEDGEVQERYDYDLNGNRIYALTGRGEVKADALVYDDQDRLLRYGLNLYAYDGLGMLSSRTDTSTGKTTRYTYDALGGLEAVQLADGTSITYVLDGVRRRVGKQVNGVLTRGYLYGRQIGPIAELEGSGQLLSQFIYASRSHVPDYLIRGGKTYRIISDHLGSPRLVIDTTSGAVAQRLSYDRFGNVLEDTNPGFQPFGFAGGLYDPDTGLVRFGARDYDPQVGRWTAKDPIQFAGGDTNLYGYVGGDPVNWVDPDGRLPVFAAVGAGMLLGYIFADMKEKLDDALACRDAAKRNVEKAIGDYNNPDPEAWEDYKKGFFGTADKLFDLSKDIPGHPRGGPMPGLDDIPQEAFCHWLENQYPDKGDEIDIICLLPGPNFWAAVAAFIDSQNGGD